MPQRLVDESEHRRGLVLGLTLAETLLLLLFVLLLALGARLSQLEHDTLSAQRERDKYKSDLSQLQRDKLAAQRERDKYKAEAESIVTGSVDTAERQEKLSTLDRKLGSDPKKLDDVITLIDRVRKINPKDPPAELKRIFKQGMRQSEVNKKFSALDDILDSDPSKVHELINVTKEAVKIDPNDPLAELKRGLDSIRESDQAMNDASGKASAGQGEAKGSKGKHDWPPIISLSKATGYSFDSGSAELSLEFRKKLSKEWIGWLSKTAEKYDADVIEVIGHTDERPLVVQRPSNLDRALFPFLQRKTEADRLAPADNAGLGLARAASVARVLIDDQRLSGLSILPLSGAQLVDLDDNLSAGTAPRDLRERRRIEIRVRGSGGKRSAEEHAK